MKGWDWSGNFSIGRECKTVFRYLMQICSSSVHTRGHRYVEDRTGCWCNGRPWGKNIQYNDAVPRNEWSNFLVKGGGTEDIAGSLLSRGRGVLSSTINRRYWMDPSTNRHLKGRAVRPRCLRRKRTDWRALRCEDIVIEKGNPFQIGEDEWHQLTYICYTWCGKSEREAVELHWPQLYRRKNVKTLDRFVRGTWW